MPPSQFCRIKTNDKCPDGQFRGEVSKRCRTKCPEGEYLLINTYPGLCLSGAPVKADPDQGASCPKSGNPINTATGNKFQRELDLAASRIPFIRSYNSAAGTVDNGLGNGWRHNWQARVVPIKVTQDELRNMPAPVDMDPDFRWPPTVTNPTAIRAYRIERADGASIAVKPDGTPFFAADKHHLKVTIGGSGFTVTSPDTIEQYDASGNLASLQYINGRTYNLSYQNGLLSQVSEAGTTFRLTFSYDPTSKRLTKVETAGKYSVVYGYSADGLLTSATFADKTQRQYRYDDAKKPGLLAGIIDEAQKRYATWAYDDKGRAVRSEHANGVDTVTLAYGSYGNSIWTDETTPLGAVRRYSFQKFNGGLFSAGNSQPGGAGCGASSSRLQYDVDGNVIESTDFNGVITRYEYNLARKLETKRTEAAYRPEQYDVSTEWHADFRLPTKITDPIRRSDFTYDAKGNLTVKTVTKLLDNSSQTWRWSYDAQNRLIDSTDAAGRITRYTYDAGGNLSTSTDPNGWVTRYTQYNPDGLPLSLTRPDGVVITLGYDTRGRLISQKVGALTTTYGYTATGLLSTITPPDGNQLTYTYDDAHRLTTIKDKLGNTVQYTLDAMGNPLKEEIKDAKAAIIQSLERQFDPLGRLQKVTRVDGGWTGYGYDPNGNTLESRNHLGQANVYGYDGLNRLSSFIDSINGVTRYEYDAADNLLSVTDPRRLVTRYEYNGFDALLKQTSPDTGVTQYTRLSDGLLATRTDAKNQKTQYEYSPGGLLKKLTFADGKTQVYAYGASGTSTGKLASLTDSSGKITYSYDSQGRVASEDRSIWNKGYVTRYGYDAAGRFNQLTYPSGRIVTYFYDAAGQVNKVTTKQGTAAEKVVIQNLTYRPFGQVQGWTFGNGEVRSSGYDNQNRITSLSLGDSTLTLGYDGASRIISQQISGGWWERMLQRLGLPIGQTHTYGYDNLDRLTEWKDGRILQNRGTSVPSSQGYGYDANGNRTALRSDDMMFKQDIDATSNRLKAASNPGGSNPVFQYDANGSRTGGGGNNYTYDARGRLTEVAGAQFTLNGLGERVAKTYQGTTTVFHYDQWGRLIAESNQLGVVRREYIYLGNTPIALVDNGMDIRNIHTDHLGTPRLLTDATKHAIWAWELGEPFGASNANEDPEGTGAKYTFNLRFPGQYFDKETGHHYNYFRDYSAKDGRYLQSDPIGLAGGINTYAYVNGNPLRYIDPLGLYSLPELRDDIRDATGGCSGNSAVDDIVANFMEVQDATSIAKTVGSMAAGGSFAKTYGGLTVVGAATQAVRDSRAGYALSGIGSRTFAQAVATGTATMAINSVLIKGTYDAGVLMGSVIRTGVNRAVSSGCECRK
ncbi:RHS repeat-associated core domain-containing protein [Chitinimonas sp. BJB300]|uniref:RHS repeat-associated core domain-containing protein n=2 Tax=Chitinimonas sp. BJB300 TaxID=1559339 RepID=UPI00130451E5|nr:RHS repeat-associated core domain-containing protein [Chitinimonas sp. BJB300]